MNSPAHDFLLLKTLIMDAIDISIDSQTNISDLEESITESIDDVKDQILDLETEMNERLAFLERRIIDFLDAYEDRILRGSCIDTDDEELPFPD